MKKKRNGFWTFVFSLLPGAGHMFMGFMKLGISMMALFFFIIFFSTWLNIGPLMFILPVLWFYSFFDCINKRYSSDEEFERYEDYYLFSHHSPSIKTAGISQKLMPVAGAALLLLGVYLVWANFLQMFSRLIPQKVYEALMDTTNFAPQIILGVVIIGLGVWLIIGKKKENDENA
jgi:hypothetical protein